mgnify:CR=1 FL=1
MTATIGIPMLIPWHIQHEMIVSLRAENAKRRDAGLPPILFAQRERELKKEKPPIPPHARKADSVRVMYRAPNGGKRWVWAYQDGNVWRRTEQGKEIKNVIEVADYRL